MTRTNDLMTLVSATAIVAACAAMAGCISSGMTPETPPPRPPPEPESRLKPETMNTSNEIDQDGESSDRELVLDDLHAVPLEDKPSIRYDIQLAIPALKRCYDADPDQAPPKMSASLLIGVDGHVAQVAAVPSGEVADCVEHVIHAMPFRRLVKQETQVVFKLTYGVECPTATSTSQDSQTLLPTLCRTWVQVPGH